MVLRAEWLRERRSLLPATVASVPPPWGPAPPHAARVSATSVRAGGLATTRRRAALFSISLSAFARAGASKGKPRIGEDRVVVPGVAASAVII